MDLEDRSYEVLAPEVKATWGVDFQLAKTITIPSGGVSQTEYVTPVDDPDAEGLETIALAAARSGDYFAAAPGERPATTRAAQDDNIEVREIKVIVNVTPQNGGIQNENYYYNFYVRIEARGERLQDVELNQRVRSATDIWDFEGTQLSEEDLRDRYDNDPNRPHAYNLVNTLWPVFMPDDNWEWQHFDEVRELGGFALAGDVQTFQVDAVPILLPPLLDAAYSFIATTTRNFLIETRVAGDPLKPLEEHEWKYTWDNTALLWTTPDAPVDFCTDPRLGRGVFKNVSGIIGLS